MSSPDMPSAPAGLRIPASREMGRETGLWPPPPGWLIITSSVLIIFAGLILYGGLVLDVALAFSAAAAFLAAACLLHSDLRRGLLRLPLAAPALLFLLAIAAALWSVTPWSIQVQPVWAQIGQWPAATLDKSATLAETGKLTGLAMAFLLGSAAGGGERRARLALRLALILGAVVAVWAMIDYASGAVFQTQRHRLEGRFLNPNTAGTVFGMIAVLALGGAVSAWKRDRPNRLARTAPYASAVAVAMVCLLTTQSRGALAATVFAMIVLGAMSLVRSRRRPPRAILGVLAAAALAALGLAVLGDATVLRLFQAGNDAALRQGILETHWRQFLDAPWQGYGLGAFSSINQPMVTPENFGVLGQITAPLNVYLQWLEEGGLACAVPMFLCVGWIIAATVRGASLQNRASTTLLTLLAVDIVPLAHGLTDSSLQTPMVAALWSFLLGLQYALAGGGRA